MRPLLVTLALSLVLPLGLAAQQQPERVPVVDAGQQPDRTKLSDHFKLLFRLIQLNSDGKIINTRSYTTDLAVGGKQPWQNTSIRSGDRVPIQVKTGEYDYTDVGTNIDVNKPVFENGELTMQVSAQSSAVIAGSTQPYNLPLTRSTSWRSDVTVTPGKPAIIFSSENPNDAGKLELELTATQVNRP